MILAVNPLDHVLDTHHWEIFDSIDLGITLPPFISKFVILQMFAAALICFFYIRLAKRVRNGEIPKGWGWNALEGVLTFIRDEIAIPTLGEHDADRFVPFLWTLFLYILVNNLMGLLPFMGSPTASILVTGALAICGALVVHGAPIIRNGPLHYVKSYYPHIEAPFGLGVPLGLFIAGMEMFGQTIKAFVLALRLFANVFGGHLVLAVILSFIVLAKNAAPAVFGMVSIGSALFIVALSLLELFIAFLQAYIFTFLATLFLGMTLHPEH